mmetsp:Transcript_34029/g.75429  ORF Transcript_34029/g.75429 Transcript_34029/m.75429 type:complete len:268 (+) Transcript_34029:175-978(+)
MPRALPPHPPSWGELDRGSCQCCSRLLSSRQCTPRVRLELLHAAQQDGLFDLGQSCCNLLAGGGRGVTHHLNVVPQRVLVAVQPLLEVCTQQCGNGLLHLWSGGLAKLRGGHSTWPAAAAAAAAGGRAAPGTCDTWRGPAAATHDAGGWAAPAGGSRGREPHLEHLLTGGGQGQPHEGDEGGGQGPVAGQVKGGLSAEAVGLQRGPLGLEEAVCVGDGDRHLQLVVRVVLVHQAVVQQQPAIGLWPTPRSEGLPGGVVAVRYQLHTA